MKKIFVLVAVLVFIVAGVGFAQKANGQSLSLWERLMTPNTELGSINQAAQVISATNAVKVDTESPSPVTSGCGNTLTPTGKINETLRCDGRSWVAAKNLLNDGTNLGLGVALDRRFKLNIRSNSTGATVYGLNEGEGMGVMGFSSNSVGVQGVSSGTTEGAVGVYGEGQIGVGGFNGARGDGSSGIAVKAVVPNFGRGFFQEGYGATNIFEGDLKIGGNHPDILGVDLYVDGGIKMLAHEGGAPVCNVQSRGTFYILGGGEDEKDVVQVCAKDENNQLAWRVLW
jgi:hypothetical protein